METKRVEEANARKLREAEAERQKLMSEREQRNTCATIAALLA